MEYFGTSLNEFGHYRFLLETNRMVKLYNQFDRLPFHPEFITTPALKHGDIVFYQGVGLTVVGIYGSCKDDRPGSKSIFWVNELITKAEMIQKIKEHPMAIKIISAMPFEVKWNSLTPNSPL